MGVIISDLNHEGLNTVIFISHDALGENNSMVSPES